MPHEVRMPQLGMNQDSAVIVSWLKAAGDPVEEGDALFEVETDKATMEVEAQSVGFLADVRVNEGADVPVGDVIALIVESEGAVADHAESAPESAPEAPDQVRDAVEEAAPPAPEPASAAQPEPPARSATNGKVLASPKAKRQALKSGIDLSALRASGVAEPIHAADVRKAPVGSQSSLAATVEGGAFTALLAHANDSGDRTRILAGFARRAWENQMETGPASVMIRALDRSEMREGREDDPVALTLVDLCDTHLSAYAPASGTTLTIAQSGDTFTLTLAFAEPAVPFALAAALLNDIAARINDPIRQLL